MFFVYNGPMSLFPSIIKYIWPEIKKYRVYFYAVFLIFGLRILFEGIIRPLYFKKIIDVLSEAGVNPQLVSNHLFTLVYTMIGISVLVLIFARVGKFIHFGFEIKMIKELRNLCFKKIGGQSQTFFANKFSGSLVTKSRRFVGAFELMFDILIYDFYSTAIILVGTFIVLFGQAPQIALMFIGFMVFFMAILFSFLKRKMAFDVVESEYDSKVSGRMADVFGNIFAVKIFSAQKSEEDSFGKVVDKAGDKAKRSWFFGLKIEVVQGFLIVLTQSTILYVMINLWTQNKISTGTVVLIQTYMVIIFDKLWNLNNALTRFMKSAADMQEMVEIFETIPEVLDPKNPEPLRMSAGELSFNSISFMYKNGKSVFNDFNLNIKNGECLGIVGHSGAGKSTIVNLVLRFSDVTSGSITIDGQDIRNVTQDDLRSVVSYVPQESVLFHRTIKENISYGKPNATDEEIIEAAKKAYAHDFISELQYGYETYVGERGVKLSGGERQRVAIARAILKNSPILILDEATSSLDSVSEDYIQKALVELMKNRTVIVIAHRLSTIQKMDRIVVLEQGKIIEEGTHKKLLKQKGVYADLWEHQSGGFIE